MTVTVARPTAQKRFEMRVAAFTTLVALAARAIAEPPDLPGDDCWDMPPDLQQLSGSFLQFGTGNFCSNAGRGSAASGSRESLCR